MTQHRQHPLVIAHRGNSAQAPENTYIAFKQAIAMHVDFIECDVQVSQDGVPVIIHDGTFCRITKEKMPHPINTLDLEDIKTIDAGSWFHPKFANERVLTLEELLCMPKGQVGIMLEVKEETFTDYAMGKQLGEILNRVGRKIPRYGPILVGSLNPNVLFNLTAFLPVQNLIPIIKEEKTLEILRPLNTKYYALHDSIAKRKLIKELHSKGADVWAWTVDSKTRAKQLVERGVNGLITNHPKKMMRLHASVTKTPSPGGPRHRSHS